MSVVLDDLVGAPRFEAVSELDRLEAIAAGVARTAWADRAKTGLGDDLVQLSRIERMVGAAKLGALAAFDASGQYRFDAQPSAATWMAAKTKADRRRVRHQIGVARKARTMPLTEDAYRNGWIAFEHVATLSRAVNANTEVFFAEAEAELVAAARTLDFDLFVRAVRAWMGFVDPDGAEERARKADERRRTHASRTFDGMVRIDAWLDAIGGTEFLAELRRLEKEMFEADWAEARARLGDRAKASDLARTAEQRRADALVEMARRSATCDTPGQPPKWVLNVMVGYATFWNELAALTGDTPGPCPCCGNHAGANDTAAGTDQIDDEATEDVEDEADLDDDLDTDDLDPAETGAVDPDEHTTETAGPRPLPDRWKAIDLRPGAGLADTRFYDIMSELEDCTPIGPPGRHQPRPRRHHPPRRLRARQPHPRLRAGRRLLPRPPPRSRHHPRPLLPRRGLRPPRPRQPDRPRHPPQQGRTHRGVQRRVQVRHRQPPQRRPNALAGTARRPSILGTRRFPFHGQDVDDAHRRHSGRTRRGDQFSANVRR